MELGMGIGIEMEGGKAHCTTSAKLLCPTISLSLSLSVVVGF